MGTNRRATGKSAVSRRRTRRPAPKGGVRAGRFVVLTGLSGSGKSQAIRALEDLGYFCVDNLPTTLLVTLGELTLRARNVVGKTAVIVDVRERQFLSDFPRVYRKLVGMPGLNPVLIFLDASDAALIRRFSETRRPHPLAPRRSALEGIREERSRLDRIRRMADQIIDTSDLTVHELRNMFLRLTQGRPEGTSLVATLLSFGFKNGVPLEADLVFDVRFLPNPQFVPRLQKQTGRDPEVLAYIRRYDVTQQFLEKTTSLLRFLLPEYLDEGKSYLTIAIGCTGGRHRSVGIAELLRKRLAGTSGVRLRVRHRDVAAE